MIDQQIIDQFKALKFERSVSALFLTLDASNANVVLVGTAPKGTAYGDIISQLPEDDIRYLVLGVTYQTQEVVPITNNEVVLIKWVPATIKVMRKMAAEKNSSMLTAELSGIGKTLNASDKEDLDFATLVKSISQ